MHRNGISRGLGLIMLGAASIGFSPASAQKVGGLPFNAEFYAATTVGDAYVAASKAKADTLGDYCKLSMDVQRAAGYPPTAYFSEWENPQREVILRLCLIYVTGLGDGVEEAIGRMRIRRR